MSGLEKEYCRYLEKEYCKYCFVKAEEYYGIYKCPSCGCNECYTMDILFKFMVDRIVELENRVHELEFPRE